LKKITKSSDLKQMKNSYVRQYIEKLLIYLLNEYSDYCTEGSISSFGAIFLVEDYDDLRNHQAFGLVTPIKESKFEFLDDIGCGFTHGVLVISNDFAISIFSPTEFLNIHFERINNNEHN